MKTHAQTVTVTGILYPVYDGDYENISGVVLSGTDEVEYLVVTDKFIDDLVNLCQEEVALTGRVGMLNGTHTIDVQEYRLVNRSQSYIPEYYPDEDDYSSYLG